MSDSPFKESADNFRSAFRNFFIRHANYLNIAFFACFVPLPLIGFFAFIISLIGFIFHSQGRFKIDESRYLLSIFVLSVINIITTSLIYFVFSLKVIDLVKAFYGNLSSFFYNLFREASPFI